MRWRWCVVLVALAGLVAAGCGGGSKDGEGDSGGGDGSALAAQYQEQVDAIEAAVDAGNGADQHTACVTVMAAIDGAGEAESAFGKQAGELCRGHVPKAMYDKTIADVEARSNQDLPPFMECVPAQTALADEAKEVDVAGLADSKAKAQELCKAAWAE